MRLWWTQMCKFLCGCMLSSLLGAGIWILFKLVSNYEWSYPGKILPLMLPLAVYEGASLSTCFLKFAFQNYSSLRDCGFSPHCILLLRVLIDKLMILSTFFICNFFVEIFAHYIGKFVTYKLCCNSKRICIPSSKLMLKFNLY
jgi:hypothetical protein